MPTNSLKTNKI